MIVTVTANPAIDRLLPLDEALERGGVIRTRPTVDQAGGKGVNVARVVEAAGVDALAVFPAPEHDSLLRALADDAPALRHVAVPVAHRVRVNLTLAEPDGTTTKLNAPGAPMASDEAERLESAVLDAPRDASWVALCGSLPSGLPVDWYAGLTQRLRTLGVAVALDTSGDPLEAALADRDAAPDLVKPNAEELLTLLGDAATSVDALEKDPELAGRLAERLRVERGVSMVLLTLGANGAVLATDSGRWFAAAPQIQARSTVGAGDASLAGFLLARESGAELPQCLATAVRHGSAAAAMPGSTPPTPSDVDTIPAPDVRDLA